MRGPARVSTTITWSNQRIVRQESGFAGSDNKSGQETGERSELEQAG